MSMLTVQINGDSDSVTNSQVELARLLKLITERIELGYYYYDGSDNVLMDINGNHVGNFTCGATNE